MGSMGHKTRDPTPDEIRKRCEKIRAEWTETERRQRMGERGAPVIWTPQELPVDPAIISPLEMGWFG